MSGENDLRLSQSFSGRINDIPSVIISVDSNFVARPVDEMQAEGVSTHEGNQMFR